MQHWLVLFPFNGALSSRWGYRQVVPVVVQQDVEGEPADVAGGVPFVNLPAHVDLLCHYLVGLGQRLFVTCQDLLLGQ